MDINYETAYKEAEKKLRKARTIVLSTCAGDKISARTVCCLSDGLTLFLSTYKDSQKIQEIKQSPNVAIVYDNLRMDAVAELFGHPSGHSYYLQKFAKKFPILAKIYKSNPNDLLVIFHPVTVRQYKYLGRPCEDVLDIQEKKAYRT